MYTSIWMCFLSSMRAAGVQKLSDSFTFSKIFLEDSGWILLARNLVRCRGGLQYWSACV